MTDSKVNTNPQHDKSHKGNPKDKRHGKGISLNFQNLNSDSAVPLLHVVISNNFDLFKKRISIDCMEKYKNLDRLIIDEAYYVPPAFDVSLYDLANDPHEVKKGRLREAHKQRDKEIDGMRIDRMSMFGYVISKLRKESQDEIQGHEDWEKIEDSRDPLNLWLVIKKCH
jgi:hypothetical protein